MSSQLSSSPRQSLNERQAETVERLFVAASEVLDDLGHERLTIRLVAERAGVSPATAYTYFASKDHLFAELFWRLLKNMNPPLVGTTPQARMVEVASTLAEALAAAPALAAAANASLLGSDPEVHRIRYAVGEMWIERFRDAIGADAPGVLLMTLSFTFSGALLMAGMGVINYDNLSAHLADAVDVVLSEQR